MTLHWWMHWFWVTSQFVVILGIPISLETGDPSIKYESTTWQSVTDKMTTTSDQVSTEPEPTLANMRKAKAINFYQPSIKGNLATNPLISRPSTNASIALNSPQENPEYRNNGIVNPYTFNPDERTANFWSGQTEIQREELIDNFRTKNDKVYEKRKDTRITWILTTVRPPTRRKSDDEEPESKFQNFSTTEEKDLTVLPLRLEERIKLVVNRTQVTTGDDNGTIFSTGIFNSSEDIEIDQELAEPRVSSATRVPIFHTDSTRLSRTRNAFVSDFQLDRAQDRSSQDDEEIDSGNIINSINVRPSAFDIAVITGSCLAMVVFLSVMISFGFIMYRRKYLNPPQTLNSDKCSNPDSSGYIDDSTIRDNSEEMYSLDNDSF